MRGVLICCLFVLACTTLVPLLCAQPLSTAVTDRLVEYREATLNRREEIKRDIQQMGRNVMPALVPVMDDSQADMRALAAECIAKVIRADDRDVIAKLIALLRDDTIEVRAQAARAIGKARTSDEAVVDELCKLLEADPEETVRLMAAIALGTTSSYTDRATTALARAVQQDREGAVREWATMALRLSYSRWIVAIIKERGPNPTVLPSDEPEWGKKFRAIVVPAYIEAMQDAEARVRSEAIEALDELRVPAPEAIPGLLKALKDESVNVRAAAAKGLGAYVNASDDVLPGLIGVLSDKEQSVWQASAASIGQRGLNALPLVVAAVQDNQRSTAGGRASIATIGQHVQDRMMTLSPSQLEESIGQIETAAKACIGESTLDAQIRRAVQALKAELASRSAARPEYKFRELTSTVTGSIFFWLVVSYVALIGACLAAWWLRPGLIRWCSDSLKATDFTIPYVNISVKLRTILIVGLLVHSRRVLDAWVRTCLSTVQKRFEELPTVKQREIRVNVPVVNEGRQFTEFCARDLRPTFNAKGNVCVLITGQGGAGKTSLACQIGKWAMEASRGRGLSAYPMLPVLLEEEVEDVGLTEVARGKLQLMSGESGQLSTELFSDLLRKKRVLVIFDHFSELSDDSRRQLRRTMPDFPIAALVVTSRNQETILGQVQTLEPVLLSGTQVSDFVKGYLRQMGEPDFFESDEEFFDSCRQLTRVVGNRTVTPLLAKLFIGQLVNAKRSGSAKNVPNDIPHMLLRYLDELDSCADPQVKRQTQADAMTVAWLCVRDEYAPATASRDMVIRRLVGADSEERLRHLETTLHVVTTTGSRHDRIRFVVDPLVEYLGAMKFVEMYRGNNRHWIRLLQRIDKVGESKNVQEFCLALMNSCVVSESGVPQGVKDEIMKRCKSDRPPSK